LRSFNNNGRIFTKRGRYMDLWPISTLPVADMVFCVADMVCGQYPCNSTMELSTCHITPF